MNEVRGGRPGTGTVGALLVAMCAAACTGEAGKPPLGQARVAIAVNAVQATEIAKMTLTISTDSTSGTPLFAPMMTNLTDQSAANALVWSAYATGIPAGTRRLFTIQAFDSSSNVLYQGSTYGDVAAGSTAAVYLVLQGPGSGGFETSLPAVSSLTASTDIVTLGTTPPPAPVTLTFTATEPDPGATLAYVWTDSCGSTFDAPAGPLPQNIATSVHWQPPATVPSSGTCNLTLSITDSNQGTVTAYIAIQVQAAVNGSALVDAYPNTWPVIAGIVANETFTKDSTGKVVALDFDLVANAADPDGDDIQYGWSVAGARCQTTASGYTSTTPAQATPVLSLAYGPGQLPSSTVHFHTDDVNATCVLRLDVRDFWKNGIVPAGSGLPVARGGDTQGLINGSLASDFAVAPLITKVTGPNAPEPPATATGATYTVLPNQLVQLGIEVLDPTPAFDPPGTPFAYSWTQSGGAFASGGLSEVTSSPGQTGNGWQAGPTIAPGSSVNVTVTNRQGLSTSYTWNFVPPSSALGGAVVGLLGSGLTLATAGEPNLPVTPGASSFSFANPLAYGTPYDVLVAGQPSSPAQTCTVANAGGIAGSGLPITVTCTTNDYGIGGTVGGLAGSGLTLATAGEPLLLVPPGATTFAFANPLPSGTGYSLSVTEQPSNPAQTCGVDNAAGEIESGPVTNVSVTCTTNQYPLGGSVVGLAGSGLVLATPGEPNLPVASSSTGFTFANPLPSGSSYSVTVAQQPSSPVQTCVVANGSGTVVDGAVSNVSVACQATVYALSGQVSGLTASGLVLATPGEPALSVGAGATAFTFANGLPSGTAYSVTVAEQPNNQTCVVQNGIGAFGNGPVTNVSVSCTPSAAQPVGTIPGLAGSVLSLSAGYLQTCVVVNGLVECMGDNAFGDLGNNSTAPSSTPVQVQGLFAYAVASGAYHNCANAFGTVDCWGDNAYGQLGNGSTAESHVPSAVQGLAFGVTGVATGGYHSCAIVDGGLWCWGDNAYGQLGNGSTAESLLPVPVSGLASGVQAVAAGMFHTCALVNGDVSCWGWNGYGQLGNGFDVVSAVPVAVPGLSGVTGVAAGWLHTCAIASGSVACWGDNTQGDLGNGSTAPSSSPVAVASLTGVTALAAGGYHTCASSNGGAYCWGDNVYGELGNGSFASSGVPALVTGLTNGVTLVAAGGYHSCAVANGAVQCWGDGNADPASGPSTGVEAIAAGAGHACAIVNGGISCWGDGAHGDLGNGAAAQSGVPVSVSGLMGAYALSAGGSHSCAIVNGGVLCWGDNASGQLGDSTTVDRAVPAAVSGLAGACAISAGGSHSCAIVNGGVECWGDNGYGQLGTGIAGPSSVPVQVSGLTAGVQAIAAGSGHTCAIVNGGVQCWGANDSGQLGNNSTAGSGVPGSVSGLAGGADAIVTGAAHSCAVVGGNVLCWGDDTSGQLGDGGAAGTGSAVPVEVTGLPAGVQALAAGARHTCALVGGGVACWGDNGSGQLGPGSVRQSSTPVTVPGLSGVEAVVAGADYTCAFANGAVECWGGNGTGQLGNGSGTGSSSPVEVFGL